MQIRMTGPNEFVVVDWGEGPLDVLEDEEEEVPGFPEGFSVDRRSYTRPPEPTTTQPRYSPRAEVGLPGYENPPKPMSGRGMMQDARSNVQSLIRQRPDAQQGRTPVMPVPTPSRSPMDTGNPYATPATVDWRSYLRPNWRR